MTTVSSHRVGDLVALLHRGPHSTRAACAALGWSRTTLSRVARHCEERGLIYRVRWRWYLGPRLGVPPEWRQTLWRMGPDLTPEEWADRIGCPVQAVLATMDKLPPYTADWTEAQRAEEAA